MAWLKIRRWLSKIFHNLSAIVVWLLVILAPNALAAVLWYVYIIASTDPTSSIAAAIYWTSASQNAYWVFMPLLCIPAMFVDYGILLALADQFGDIWYMKALAFVVGLSPIWLAYPVEAGIHLYRWNNDCNGFDATIDIRAVHSGDWGQSYVDFPVGFGSQRWQMWNPNGTAQIYGFESTTGDDSVIYDMDNDTYFYSIDGTVDVGTFPSRRDSLAFPDLGLSSEGNWLRACFAPAVELKNSTGDIVLKTGLTAYTTCAYEKACVMKSSGVDAIIVAIGRILIELQPGAQCCSKK
jgi:hypothetical protein